MRECARIEEGLHHLVHPLREKSSSLASLLAVHRHQMEGSMLRVCQNSETWRNGWYVISRLTQVQRRVVVSAGRFGESSWAEMDS